jgi:hypothetical protein
MTAGAFSPALAGFMRAGRAVDEKEIARPGDLGSLRRWERDKGVLAVMIDQSPGSPEEWVPLGTSGLETPCPSRLLDWIEARRPEKLFVAVQWEPGNRIRFRYLPATGPCLKSSGVALVSEALSGPGSGQYNWSYPKIRPRSV